VVIPVPVVANTAKWKVGIADVKNGVVDGSTAKTYLAEHLLLLLFIAGKMIQSQ